MGTGSFLGVKRPGRGVDYPPASSAEVKERVELYLYSPSGPSWSVLGWTLPLLYLLDGERTSGEYLCSCIFPTDMASDMCLWNTPFVGRRLKFASERHCCRGAVVFKWPTHHSASCCTWRQLAPLFELAVSRGPRVFAHRIAVNFMCLLSVFEGSAGDDLHRPTDTRQGN